jgi:hypothetical protein
MTTYFLTALDGAEWFYWTTTASYAAVAIVYACVGWSGFDERRAARLLCVLYLLISLTAKLSV